MFQTSIPIIRDRYLKGLTWPDYVAQMKVNRERITELFEEIRLALDDRQVFA
jgi:hypothetical protein